MKLVSKMSGGEECDEGIDEEKPNKLVFYRVIFSLYLIVIIGVIWIIFSKWQGKRTDLLPDKVAESVAEERKISFLLYKLLGIKRMVRYSTKSCLK